MRKRDKLKNIEQANKRLLENTTLGRRKREEYMDLLFDVLYNRDRHDPIRVELEDLIQRIESPESEEGQEWSNNERKDLNNFFRNTKEI